MTKGYVIYLALLTIRAVVTGLWYGVMASGTLLIITRKIQKQNHGRDFKEAQSVVFWMWIITIVVWTLTWFLSLPDAL